MRKKSLPRVLSEQQTPQTLKSTLKRTQRQGGKFGTGSYIHRRIEEELPPALHRILLHTAP